MLDMHTHIGPERFNRFYDLVPKYCSPEELDELLSQFGFSDAVVFANPFTEYFDIESVLDDELIIADSMACPYHRENREVLETIEAFERFSSALMIANHRGHSNLEDVKSLYRDYSSVVALKFHTLGTHTSPAALQSSGFLEFADAKELPVIVHLKKYTPDSDSDLPRYGHPGELVDLAEDHPGVDFIGAHTASFSGEFMSTAEGMDNLFFDVSPSNFLISQNDWRAADAIEIPEDARDMIIKLVEKYPNAVLWGSDFPWSRVGDIEPIEEYRTYDKLPTEYKDHLQQNNHRVFSHIHIGNS